MTPGPVLREWEVERIAREHGWDGIRDLEGTRLLRVILSTWDAALASVRPPSANIIKVVAFREAAACQCHFCGAGYDVEKYPDEGDEKGGWWHSDIHLRPKQVRCHAQEILDRAAELERIERTS